MRVATHCTCESHKLSRVNNNVYNASLSKDAAKVLLIFVKKPAKCRVYLENYVIARETVETFSSSMSAVDFCGARHCLRPI